MSNHQNHSVSYTLTKRICRLNHTMEVGKPRLIERCGVSFILIPQWHQVMNEWVVSRMSTAVSCSSRLCSFGFIWPWRPDSANFIDRRSGCNYVMEKASSILRRAGFEETFLRIKLELVDSTAMERREAALLRALANKITSAEKSDDICTDTLRSLSFSTDGRVPKFDICRFIVDINEANERLDNQNQWSVDVRSNYFVDSEFRLLKQLSRCTKICQKSYPLSSTNNRKDIGSQVVWQL